jgi:predicted dehydrogenase
MAAISNIQGSNDRIAIGVIGLGPCGGAFYPYWVREMESTNNLVLAGVCDVFDLRLEGAGKRHDLKPGRLFTDYRRMLDRADIDAVVVATHDPLHAEICMDSLKAGKHVYCELPLTRFLEEGFQLYDHAKESQKVFQTASIACTAGGWRKCGELVRAGRIGTLTRCEAAYCRNSTGGEWNYLIETATTEENIDWQKWLGPVKRRAFSAEQFRRWYKYFDYCVGPLGTLGSHRLYELLLGSGSPEYPVRVNCVSSHHVHSDLRAGMPEREVPGHVQVQAEFPDGWTLSLTCSTVCARGLPMTFHGHKGTIEVAASGNKARLMPEEEFAEEITGATYNDLQEEDKSVHLKSWCDCIRSGEKPIMDLDLAIKVQTIVSLAEMSDRLKTTCLFDATTRQITDGGGKRLAPFTYGSPG